MSSSPQGLAPYEGLEFWFMNRGHTRPLVDHATGCRQASLGTSVPRMLTVAPKPKAHSDLA